MWSQLDFGSGSAWYHKFLINACSRHLYWLFGCKSLRTEEWQCCLVSLISDRNIKIIRKGQDRTINIKPDWHLTLIWFGRWGWHIACWHILMLLHILRQWSAQIRLHLLRVNVQVPRSWQSTCDMTCCPWCLLASRATHLVRHLEDLRATAHAILCGIKPFVVSIPSFCSGLDLPFTPGSCAVACHLLNVCMADMVSDWAAKGMRH